MIGAPALTAAAALRAGTGLVKILSHPQVIPHALAIEPSATGLVYPSSDSPGEWNECLRSLGTGVVLAVGPGMGVSARDQQRLRGLFQSGYPMVLDADGLNNLAAMQLPWPVAGGPVVLTPHPGEFKRLAQPCSVTPDATDPDSRPAAARQLARALNAVVVLKGRHTVIADAAHHTVNSTGNPALATAGSGDVLTGVIASLIAQGLEPFDAARLGVYLHGLAADLWAEQHGPCGMTARELAALIPDALQRHRLGS